jgi:hypothetical protein
MKILLLIIASLVGIYFYARSRKPLNNSNSSTAGTGSGESRDNSIPNEIDRDEELRNDEIY